MITFNTQRNLSTFLTNARLFDASGQVNVIDYLLGELQVRVFKQDGTFWMVFPSDEHEILFRIKYSEYL